MTFIPEEFEDDDFSDDDGPDDDEALPVTKPVPEPALPLVDGDRDTEDGHYNPLEDSAETGHYLRWKTLPPPRAAHGQSLPHYPGGE